MGVHRLDDFSPAELRRLALARDRVSHYLQLADAFQWAHAPLEGSPFASGTRENGGIWWREIGDLMLAAAFDHLLAFNTMLHRGPLPRLAGYSLLRGIVEPAAIAWWLFDSTASESDRVQRGFEERLRGSHARTALIAPENVERHKAARAAIVAQAVAHGLSEKPDSRKPGLTHFGRPRLDTNELLVRILPEKPSDDGLADGEFLWRTLSAYAHGETWTSIMGLREAEDDTKPRRLVVNLETFLGAAYLTMRVYDEAFDRRMTLAGHADWALLRGLFPAL